MCCCIGLHQVHWDSSLVLEISKKAHTVTNYIALKTYDKCGISNSTENMVLFNEIESLNNGNGDGDFTAFYDQYELHTALPFCVKYLWMFT